MFPLWEMQVDHRQGYESFVSRDLYLFILFPGRKLNLLQRASLAEAIHILLSLQAHRVLALPFPQLRPVSLHPADLVSWQS